MIDYSLPRTVEIGGTEYEIRTDYRMILDILSVFMNPELEDQDKLFAALDLFCFSPGWENIPPKCWEEAIKKCVWFIDGGDQPARRAKSPKLMDWEQDFRLIAAPINRVHGSDIRDIPYDPETNQGGLHWWTFLGLYMEIGDCLYAQVVRIRDMKSRGKRLDKHDQDFYRRNREIIDIQTKYTDSEQAFLKEWGAL